jgi:hypothetical protein
MVKAGKAVTGYAAILLLEISFSHLHAQRYITYSLVLLLSDEKPTAATSLAIAA